jgi:hypothetical protein
MSEPVVIFDTVVFVRALINPHSFWGRLVFEHYREYQLIISPQILSEIIEVLRRPELTSRFSAIQGIDAESIIETLSQAEVVMPEGEPQASRDVKDNKFIAAAEASNADYLVSEDRDLLDLVKYKDTRIVTAREFLEILRTFRKAA